MMLFTSKHDPHKDDGREWTTALSSPQLGCFSGKNKAKQRESWIASIMWKKQDSGVHLLDFQPRAKIQLYFLNLSLSTPQQQMTELGT